ncbi:MAG: calcium/sodium antiporter [Alphaproteobacteria bacterium]|nr:calcium/sodium antiporter [Alphaproteobacteria bacterium]
MLTAALLIVAGLAALFQGGDALVLGASRVARRFGVSPLVVGLTVVAFATSAPELAVSLIAAWEGTPDIAVGNVLGSNIFNIWMAVGLVALIAPIAVQPTLFRREVPLCIGATLLVMVFSATDGQIGRIEGAALATLLLGFLTVVVLQALAIARRVLDDEPDEDDDEVERDTGAAVLVLFGALAAAIIGAGEGSVFLRVGLAVTAAATWLLTGVAAAKPDSNAVSGSAIFLGLGMLIVGSDALVEGCTAVATAMGVSEAVIGLTVVAIGTSAPELATGLQAVRKGQDDIAVGNALGSNLFNLLAVLGVTALVKPIQVDPRFLHEDAWVALAAVVALFPAILLDNKVTRRLGLAYVGAWSLYTAWLVAQELGVIGA